MTIADLQAARDQLEIGDEVLVQKQVGGPSYRGKVKEINARMAVVQLQHGRKCEVIPLTKLSKVIDAAQQLTPDDRPSKPPAPPPLQDRPKRKARHEQLAPVIPIAPADADAIGIAPGSVLPPSDDVDAWLEMGRGLIQQMQQRIKALNARAAESERDAAALVAEADRVAKSMLAEAQADEREAKVLERRVAMMRALEEHQR